MFGHLHFPKNAISKVNIPLRIDALVSPAYAFLLRLLIIRFPVDGGKELTSDNKSRIPFYENAATATPKRRRYIRGRRFRV